MAVRAAAALLAVLRSAAAGSPPPAPLTELALAIGGSALPCPAGLARIGAGSGWDSDFNDGAGGDYVYLCFSSSPGGGAQKPPITALHAAASLIPHPSGGACPDGYEQLEGNMNQGSKNKGYVYLCASRKAGSPPIDRLIGEKASTGCAAGLEAVEGGAGSGKPFNFDPAGVGVVLCAGHPPAPLTTLALAIGANATTDTCPPGTTRIATGHSSWDGDFNSGAGGTYVYLCSGSGSGGGGGGGGGGSAKQGPITALHAVASPTAARPPPSSGATSSASSLCPDGYEQLEGNMNQGSRNKGYTYLCVSRKNATAAIVALVGEKASTGCAAGFEAVPGDDGKPFNFDAAGEGVVLCSHGVGGGGNCPPPPPAQPSHGIVALTAVISAVAGACCPAGFEPVGAAGGNSTLLSVPAVVRGSVARPLSSSLLHEIGTAAAAAAAAAAWNGDLNDNAGGNFVYLCATKGGPDSVRSAIAAAAGAGAVGAAEGEREGASGGGSLTWWRLRRRVRLIRTRIARLVTRKWATPQVAT